MSKRPASVVSPADDPAAKRQRTMQAGMSATPSTPSGAPSMANILQMLQMQGMNPQGLQGLTPGLMQGIMQQATMGYQNYNYALAGSFAQNPLAAQQPTSALRTAQQPTASTSTASSAAPRRSTRARAPATSKKEEPKEEDQENEEKETSADEKEASNDDDEDQDDDDDETKGKQKRRGRKRKDASAAASSSSSGETKKERKRMFTKELRSMMYGFGDVANPSPETVELMDDLVMEYIADLSTKAMERARKRGVMKLKTEDLVFMVRKDRKKYARVEELLRMYEELKRARKAFDLDEGSFEKAA